MGYVQCKKKKKKVKNQEKNPYFPLDLNLEKNKENILYPKMIFGSECFRKNLKKIGGIFFFNFQCIGIYHIAH